MALPNIKLDERTFQDLVDEAKLRIPRYTPEWTNHNVSDPGVTLIELFAYMVDQLLYQINRVPEKNYRAFLDMIGVRMSPPNPAQAELTFRLSAELPNAQLIPKGTEIATVRTETQSARIYTTDNDLKISPPGLKYFLTSANNENGTDVSKVAFDKDAPGLSVFQTEPQPGNTFYLGFTSNIASHTLILKLDWEKLGVGINPSDPPLIWEYWDEQVGSWMSLEIARDTSEGLTINFSEVELYIPVTSGTHEMALVGSSEDAVMANWVRCRYRDLGRGQSGYNQSPILRSSSAYSIGGTVPASHSEVIRNEEFGRSKGEPGQRFKLRNTPVLSLDSKENEFILVDELNGKAPEIWKHVQDFSASGSHDPHFTLDNVSGEISFGPAIRNPQGVETQFGKIPPFGSLITMVAYRTGGGIGGNVGSNTITVLKSSVPYITSVTNRRAASGGTNAESLEHALVRGPKTLRARNRAVTAEDFETLTREATSGVARVRCLSPSAIDRNNPEEYVEPGTVVMLIVPEVDPDLRELRPEHLAIPAGMRQSITDYLDERRLLTTQIELATPKYQWVTVQARIKTLNQFANERVKREAERRLYHMLRPVQGGPDPLLRFDQPGEGWPFGRILYISELYPILQTIDGVEFVEKLELFPVIDLARGQAGAPVSQITTGPRGLLCSYRHQVVLI